MAVIYLGRDNSIILGLTQDGQSVVEGAVTKASFGFPPNAVANNSELVIETGVDSQISLIDNGQSVKIVAGDLPLRPGVFTGYLTIYDNNSPDGIAWDEVAIEIKHWIPD